MNELVVSSFVAPHYIEELGCDGLTVEDIATSLGIEATKLREKLNTNFIHRLESLIICERIMVNINGVQYKEFFLSTDAAKFVVARHESVLGDGYLIYLIRRDRALSELLREKKMTPDDLCLTFKNSEALALENETLKSERARRDKEANEPITSDEYALLDRLANARLKMFGRKKPKYKKAFATEVLDKFFQPGLEKGLYGPLLRKNWKPALDYVKARTWSLLEGY